MFYREAGQFKTTYAADMAIFPIRQDRYGMALILFVAFVVIPVVRQSVPHQHHDDPVPDSVAERDRAQLADGIYRAARRSEPAHSWASAPMPATSSRRYSLEVNILVWIIVSGLVSALVGVAFGLPSLRIKGFYLAVATLAAQFFLEWCFARVPWLVNYNNSGAIEVPTETLFGLPVTGPTATPVTRYLVVLTIVSAMAWIASNIVHGRIGRMWMAVRDMDIAAELIGIRLLRAKLLAFAVSSFIIGVAGALMVFLWFGAAEAEAFNIDLSFQVLFMIIIGGLGSIVGAFFGAAVIYLMPIALRALPAMLDLTISSQTIDQLTTMITGVLIIAIPDRRAAWIGSALANREAQTARLAIPLLKRRAKDEGGRTQ